MSLGLFAQIDTEFWFAAPDLEASHAQQPIRFCISSFEQPATVVFEQPANSFYTPQTFHLDANDFHVYDVSSIINIVETQPYNTILNYGFHITSDTPVSVYYESDNNNSEIYSLKGANALGTNFLVPMQYTFKNNYSTTCSRIEVVATQDATTVIFVASQNIKGGVPAGVPFTVTLNRGQSYAIEASDPSPAGHLRNTWITSDKPIAVNTSDDSVYHSGNYDLVGDQIVPVDLLGYEYLALWNNTQNEYLYFFPTEDNTNIYLDGSQTPIATLNIGEEYDYHMNSAAVYIQSDKPIAVFQLACADNSAHELGGTMLPHINCTGSRKTVYKRNSNADIVITLVVKTDCVNDFRLNGSANYLTSSDFSVVPSNEYYSYCKKNVSQYVPTNGLMTLENVNEDGYYQLGVFSKSSGTCSYGYFSDYRQYASATFDMDDTYCKGDDIVFNFTYENTDNISLILPDGTIMTQQPFILTDAQPSQSGTYYLQGEACSSNQILDDINIVIREPHAAMINLIGCGEQHWHGFVFDHAMDTMLVFSNPNDCDSIYYVHVEKQGLYEDEISLVGCSEVYWHGFVFDHPEETEIVIPNPNDCDSVYHVHVDLIGVHTENVSLVGCGNQHWHGHVFDHSCDTTLTVNNPSGCDSVYTIHVDIQQKSMELEGITQIAIASDLWPGVYNYHILNQDEFDGCQINWTCSNPDWTISPFPGDNYWLQLIANSLGTAVLTAEATCQENCHSIATIQLNATHFDVEETEAIPASLYPNPANNNLTISSEQIKQVKFFNCYGQEMIVFDAGLEDVVIIDTSILTDGLYLVEIVTTKGKMKKRLIISK